MYRNAHTHNALPPVLLIPLSSPSRPSPPPTPLRFPFLPEVFVAPLLMWFRSFKKRTPIFPTHIFHLYRSPFFFCLNSGKVAMCVHFHNGIHPPWCPEDTPSSGSVRFDAAKASTRLPLTVWPLALLSYKLHVSPLQSHCYCMDWSVGLAPVQLEFDPCGSRGRVKAAGVICAHC